MQTPHFNPIRRALISVSDKKGIVEFAKKLQALEIEIISTGGTAKELTDNGIKVIDITEFTGFPEMMDGRVKTLHPLVYGGILAIRDNEMHMEEVVANNIKLIDMVVVNLYPFEKVPTIENIDIGGPSLVRSAAKNYQYVTVVPDPSDYKKIIRYLEKQGEVPLETRAKLASKAFYMTAKYDQAINNYFRTITGEPELMDLHYEKLFSLRYGENPHQKAVFFKNPYNSQPNVTNAKILQGKQLSFNNILDTDAALEHVKDFEKPAVVVLKHTNPCGVAVCDKIEDAFKKAYEADPLSAFGCVVAMNRPCTENIVDYINKKKIFVEIIVAPSFTNGALKKLSKRVNLRLLETGKLYPDSEKIDIKKVAGGVLIQHADTRIVTEKDLKIVSKKKPTKEQIRDMLFARTVVKHVKSNAVVFAKNMVTTGVGAGQMSRVDSVNIATSKGGKKVPGSVMASDAFFPFPDGVEQAYKAGIKAIIQPGGSIRDQEVIKRVDELGMSMVFTGIRSFRH
ncbi:bifunctional phosphoribosylaminoimidazolecarboxamide formyltransferase/IMP cyclohydrolase [Candidatus Peregrinibacteria bacterium]|nr:bifunctional phosphoribosylaminoimidazolecarboxamide formyltransferase/IMP cyclohydrolase [Candidatus Peregrinibacteria bacterium]